MGIYAPNVANGAKEIYFKEIIQKLDQASYEQVMLVEYFNGIVDNKVDRKLKKNRVMTKNYQKFF